MIDGGGKGFTEWTNVTKAKPNFKGHYQPHRPIHLGYYDLRVPEVMQEQAQLAKNYGVYGFSYYFYWFDGVVLMETPLRAMLNNKSIDMPFCLTWANENWTRRWTGDEQDVLIAQNYSETDAIALLQYMMDYFQDERYIRIDGKPIFIIYRPNDIPNIKQISHLWRKEAEKHGLPGLYLISVKFYNMTAPEDIGFDALVEFPPHKLNWTSAKNIEVTNREFSGTIIDYEETIQNSAYIEEPTYKLFRSVMLSWDNTARRQNSPHIFSNFSIRTYQRWLAYVVNKVYRNEKYSQDEKLVFINAWNEWAEGTHLEPDEKFGYSYLQATYDVISQYDSQVLSELTTNVPKTVSEHAIIAHVFFEDLWPDMRQYLFHLREIKADFYISVASASIAIKVKKDFPEAYVQIVENRGRDILPFIRFLSLIQNKGYMSVCKIHSKKSSYRNDGEFIRKNLFDSLLGNMNIINSIVLQFKENPQLGLCLPNCAVLTHETHMGSNEKKIAILSGQLNLNFEKDIFPAGSMFWFRPTALLPLLKISEDSFLMEPTPIDGAMEHAVERLFCTIVKESGYTVSTC